MIKVEWPFEADNDEEVCNWLEELIKDKEAETIFELRGRSTLYFTREDDAIAFKLRFGL